MSDTLSIGIDLGTTNSVIAHAEAGELSVLPSVTGHRTIPSVVAYDGEQALVGRQAANQAIQHPDWTVFSVKRYMGSDETIILGPNESEFLPEELSGLILKHLIQGAESRLDAEIESAVITVPAYFSNRQRKATKRAGEIAGIDVDRIINEPTAACLAYGLKTGEDKTIFVYDLGGGTFDASLISMTDGLFEVIGTNGNSQLGGDDWDGAIVDWLETTIEEEYGITLENTPAVEERLFDAARQAKHELSSRSQTEISIPFLQHSEGTHTIEETLSREKIDKLTFDLGEETLAICAELLDEVEYSATDIDEVLLVGGATRMPQIQDWVTEYFNQQPSKQINPDEAVAQGAAAQAAIINHQALPSPADGSESTQPTASSSSSSPAVARADAPLLLDVTPHSMGIEAHESRSENYYDILIERNTLIPTTTSGTYTTLADDQTHVEISVYQGDAPTVEENELLDEFRIGPIPQRPAGEPDIEATFAIDENGILTVSAMDIDYDIGGSIQINSVFDVPREEIATMRSNLPTLRNNSSS